MLTHFARVASELVQLDIELVQNWSEVKGAQRHVPVHVQLL